MMCLNNVQESRSGIGHWQYLKWRVVHIRYFLINHKENVCLTLDRKVLLASVVKVTFFFS